MRYLIPLLSFGLFLPACERNSTALIASGTSETAEESASQNGLPLPEVVSFNEHIQPILSEYCYHCHGPDAGTREPSKEPLRLDIEEDAFAMRDFGGPVIIKGNPAESLIIKLMHSKDRSVVMPPPESHKTMNPREIALVERWIEQGAEYEEHWSYGPVAKPDALDNDWSEHPIDGFILEKLTEAGLDPNPPEDPRRLHRRLSLDLTGLPPTPAETDAFASAFKNNPDSAIASEADRMLETMQSAEHFARHWLDAVRYADTHGIHIDNYRAIWPFRDWVVRAFNENMPWDQFTVEQIAGDMIPDRSLDQRIASGFNRCLSTTGEGGAIGEEYEAIYATDRVDTVGAVWLGLTASCAACHDHKFDPLSTKEFYQLTAFFRNNTMSAMDGNRADHAPSIFVPAMEDRERWTALEKELAETQELLTQRRKAAQNDYRTWLAGAETANRQETDSTLVLHLPLTEKDGKIHGMIHGEKREWDIVPTRIEGPLGSAVDVSAGNIDLGNIGSFSRTDQVSFGGFIRVEGKPSGPVISKIDTPNNLRGWDLWLQDGRIGTHIIDSWDKSANKVLSPTALENGKWHHVMVIFDGSISAHQSTSLFIDGKRVAAGPDPNTVGGSIENDMPLRLGSRGTEGELNGKVALQDFRMYSRNLLAQEVTRLAESTQIQHWLALAEEERSDEQKNALFEHYIANVDAPSIAILKNIDTLKKEETALRNNGSATLVFEEKPNSKPEAHVLIRGDYTQKGDKVAADTPAYLPPMSDDMPKNRMGLAQWINDPANPLPARVTVNRMWYYFFGTGIVETTEDFGIMGARPSHPKLLDWLAVEFVENDWDFRHIVRTIVTSSTYRQAGHVTDEKLEKDPANLLLSRGPRTRLDAEQIRDLALAGSGLLSTKVGGPPVKPYQPEGIWEAVAMPQSNTKNYKQDQGEALYRRSIYTFIKRTAGPPTMEILDAPSRETFCVRRDRTNTPLQALALLNDPQFVEANRVLAQRAIKSSDDFDGRIDHITLHLIGRVMDAEEKTFVRESLDEALAFYTANLDEARSAIAVGETKADESIPADQLATWTLIATQVFNLDETVTR